MSSPSDKHCAKCLGEDTLSASPDKVSVPTKSVPKTDRFCIRCGIKTSQSCAQCHAAYYCSTDCQKSDYAVHKVICRPLSVLKRPENGPRVVRALFFPVDADTPRWIWLPVEQGQSEIVEQLPTYSVSYEDIRATLGVHQNSVPDHASLPFWMVPKQRNIGKEVWLRSWMIGDAIRTKQPLNTSLASLLRGPCKKVRGPVLVYCNKTYDTNTDTKLESKHIEGILATVDEKDADVTAEDVSYVAKLLRHQFELRPGQIDMWAQSL